MLVSWSRDGRAAHVHDDTQNRKAPDFIPLTLTDNSLVPLSHKYEGFDHFQCPLSSFRTSEPEEGS